MIELKEGQFELRGSLDDETDGFHFGYGTDINVRVFDPGTPEIRDADNKMPMGDGVRFGRDFKSGRTLSIEANALSNLRDENKPAAAMSRADLFGSAWSDDYTRATPGAVSVLRWVAGGRGRRVYGRPRRFASDPGHYHTGEIPITADFTAADDLFYDDKLNGNSVGIVPAYGGGASWPFTWPLYWNQAPGVSPAGTIVVTGTRPTWPTILVHGPIIDPTISIPGFGDLKISTQLLYDQYLVLDTRPWSRGVRRNDGANLANVYDRRASSLSRFRLPPGSFQIVLRGTDPTGTAFLTVQWRNAYSSV